MSKLFSIILSAFVVCAVMSATEAQTRRSRNAGAARPASRAKQAAAPATTDQAPAAVSKSSAADPLADKAESCGCESQLPEVLAIVNGQKITVKEINTPENRLEEQIKNLENQIIEARSRELDLQINSKLLEAEAKRRGQTAAKLFETEAIAKVKPPTEAEAQAFYDANKARIQGEFANIKNDIIAYLRDERQREEAGRLAERLRAQARIKILADKVMPPVTAADRARVLATVNGEPITSGDIEKSLLPLVSNVQQQIYSVRKAALDMRINDILLEQEAKRRNTTAQALLEAEVMAKLPKVSEADAEKFYNQNKDQINGEFAGVKDQILQYLQTQEANKATSNYAVQLRRGATVQTFLTAPESPVLQIATDDQPTKGSPAAQVTIVEFTDFQCPSCAQMHPVINRIASEYGERVRVVVRDFPLSQHQHAFKAAEAAEAAREQGKYWEYVALLFANQKALDVPRLKEYASQTGLNRQQFDAALDSGKFAVKVQRDLQDGYRLGINSTPTVFINGRRLTDRSYEAMKQVIDQALRR